MKQYSRLLWVALLCGGTSSSAAPCPARTSWPNPDWAVATRAPRREATAEALRAYMFGPDARAHGIHTDGVIVIHGGVIVFEQYARGFTATMRHLVWSVAKTFTHALAGRAVALHRLDVDASICRYLAGVPPDNCAITVRSLLDMSSGLDWHEPPEQPPNLSPTVVEMLFRDGYRDMVSYVDHLPRRDPPGATWEYSSGDITLLGAVVRAVLEPGFGRDFPWTALLDRIGARNVTWERDEAGALAAGSYLWTTPRDLARLGYLYLNDGCWQGERLLPDGWVSAATRVNDAFRRRPLHRRAGDVYGRELWLNRPVPQLGQPRPWPSVPEDAYAATGRWNQLVLIVPSLDMIVVRTGEEREEGVLDVDRFFRLALEVGTP